MGTISLPGGTIYIKEISSVINYSTNGSSYSPVTFPCSINNTSVSDFITVIFESNITINNTTDYFICMSDRIQFGKQTLNNDGSRPLIAVMVNSYPGLIKNGELMVNGQSYIYVFNLEVNGVSYTLSNGGGWIGQKDFGNGATENRIINCQTSGDVPTNGGGITGQRSKNVSFYTCNSSGLIGQYGGGIAGSESDSLLITNCYSLFDISDHAGGIVGASTNNSQITGCYSIGQIGSYGGGIAGETCNIVAVSNSYTTGYIGDNGGGIFGSGASDCTSTNCYTTGTIGVNSGGIFGAGYSGSSIAYHCYTSGVSIATNSGIYSGNNIDGATNYSEANNGSSGWSDSNANNVLTSVTGDIQNRIWFSEGINIPYKIYVGYSPYTINNIDNLTKSVTVYQFDVAAGQSTTGILGSITYTSSILLQSPVSPTITINDTNGVISTTTSTPLGQYILIVNCQSMGFYLLTRVIVNVSAGGGGQSGSVYNAFSRSIGSACDLITSARAAFTIAASQNPSKKKATKYGSYDEILALKKAVNKRV